MKPTYAIDAKKLERQTEGEAVRLPLKKALELVASLGWTAPNGPDAQDVAAIGVFFAKPSTSPPPTERQVDGIYAMLTHPAAVGPTYDVAFSLVLEWADARRVVTLLLGGGAYRDEPIEGANHRALVLGGARANIHAAKVGLALALAQAPGDRALFLSQVKEANLPLPERAQLASILGDRVWGNVVIDEVLAAGTTNEYLLAGLASLADTPDRFGRFIASFGKARAWIAERVMPARLVGAVSAEDLSAILIPEVEYGLSQKWKASGVDAYLKALAHVKSPEVAQVLASWMGEKSIAKIATEYFRKHPDLAPALSSITKGKAKIAAQGLLASLAREQPAPGPKAGKASKTKKKDLEGAQSVELPARLTAPPWLAKKRPERPSVDLTLIIENERFDPSPPLHPWVSTATAESDRALVGTRPIELIPYWQIQRGTDALLMAWLNATGSDAAFPFAEFHHRLGDAAVPFVMDRLPAVVTRHPYPNIVKVVAHTVSSRLALPIARALPKRSTLPYVREGFSKWMNANAEVAAVGLVPAALGTNAIDADIAEDALRTLMQEGHEPEVKRAVSRYGKDAEVAFEALLQRDPKQRVPAKMPLKAKWAAPERLTPLTLVKGGALGAEHVAVFIQMLQISPFEAPYQGTLDVLALLEGACRAPFAAALLDEYVLAGSPPSHDWILGALALLAPEVAIARLPRQMRAWAADGKVVLLHRSLETLCEIGSDEALVLVYDAGQRSRYDDTRTKVRELLELVATGRELAYGQLEDRLVPELGLEAGPVELDLGARKLTVRLDDHLEAVLEDDDGATLAAFPRKNKSDDPTQYATSKARYDELLEAAQTVGRGQILRFERALRSQQSWSVADLREHVLPQPLVRRLVTRLVWQIEGTNTLFRIAEDLTLADSGDSALPWPASEQRVVLAHPLLAPSALAFTSWLGDYEIVQPFAQVGRETFALTGDEVGTGIVRRADGRKVSYLSVLALTMGMGWKPGAPGSRGIDRIHYALDDGRTVRLGIKPGLLFGQAKGRPEQTIGLLDVIGADRKPADLTDLPPLLASELLRDAMSLA
jgi:hypothetical protein